MACRSSAVRLFFQKLADGIACQHGFCQQELQFCILDLQGFQPLGVFHLQAAVLALPAIVGGWADLLFTAEVFHRFAFRQFFIGFTQEFYDLFGLSSVHQTFAPF
jgi:hypothetical protein